VRSSSGGARAGGVSRIALAVALAVPALALVQAPAAGVSIRKEKAPGAEAEFVDTPWRPDVFEAMETGATTPEGQRSWAFARLATSSYFAMDGTVIPPGRYVLVLTPKTGGLPMTLEVRRGPGRELFADPNAMAPPQGGEMVYKAPAAFAPSAEPVPVLDVTLAGWRGAISLTIRYGNRKLTKELIETMP
jgi:hypothetical protein